MADVPATANGDHTMADVPQRAALPEFTPGESMAPASEDAPQASPLADGDNVMADVPAPGATPGKLSADTTMAEGEDVPQAPMEAIDDGDTVMVEAAKTDAPLEDSKIDTSLPPGEDAPQASAPPIETETSPRPAQSRDIPGVKLTMRDSAVRCTCTTEIKRIGKDLEFGGITDGAPYWVHKACKPPPKTCEDFAKFLQLASTTNKGKGKEKPKDKPAENDNSFSARKRRLQLKNFSSVFHCDGPCRGSKSLKDYFLCKKCCAWQHKPCVLYGEEGDCNGPVCNRCYMSFILHREEIREWQRKRLLEAARDAWKYLKWTMQEGIGHHWRKDWVRSFLVRYFYHNQGVFIKFIKDKEKKVKEEAAKNAPPPAPEPAESSKTKPAPKKRKRTSTKAPEPSFAKMAAREGKEFKVPALAPPPESSFTKMAAEEVKETKATAPTSPITIDDDDDEIVVTSSKKASKPATTFGLPSQPRKAPPPPPPAYDDDDDEIVVSSVRKTSKPQKPLPKFSVDEMVAASITKMSKSANNPKTTNFPPSTPSSRRGKKRVTREDSPTEPAPAPTPTPTSSGRKSQRPSGERKSYAIKLDLDDDDDEIKVEPPPKKKVPAANTKGLRGPDSKTCCTCPNMWTPAANFCFPCQSCDLRQHNDCAQPDENGVLETCNICIGKSSGPAPARK